jgi:indolepyruvate ferredoxin oxidoreductase
MLEMIIADITLDNYDIAVDLATVPEHIRGFGVIKDENIAIAMDRQATLLKKFGSATEVPAVSI